MRSNSSLGGAKATFPQRRRQVAFDIAKTGAGRARLFPVDPVSIVFVSTPAEMAEALGVRRAVFIEEQGVSEDIEIDENDGEEAWGQTSHHALLRLEGKSVATGRLLVDEGREHNAHIGRVAVLAEHRRQGFGRLVMEALEERARGLGYPGITLAAQTHAIGFYERLGYAARGEVFIDAGIEHRWMDLSFEAKV